MDRGLSSICEDALSAKGLAGDQRYARRLRWELEEIAA